VLGPPTGWSAARIVVTLSRDRPESSGKELWRFETDERLGLGSPVAANGMVYVSDENTLYAMEQ
jgi:outer membrane protein assembly factor BamB